jgi:hypothetical protein
VNPQPPPLARRLPYFSALLLIEGLIGLVPRTWKVDPLSEFDGATLVHLGLQGALLLLLGTSALLVARSTGFRFLSTGCYLALAVMVAGPPIALKQTDVLQLLRPLGWLLVAVSIGGLWGTATVLKEEPGNLQARSLGSVYAIVAFAGFVFSTLPEVLGMMGKVGPYAGLSRSPTSLFNGVIQLPGRVCLLWAAIQPLRRLSDDDPVRKSARSTHRVLSVWVALSLISWLASILVYSSTMRRGSIAASMSLPSLLWRMAAYYTLLATAVTSVALSLRNPDPGYKSPPNLNSSGGAEA